MISVDDRGLNGGFNHMANLLYNPDKASNLQLSGPIPSFSVGKETT